MRSELDAPERDVYVWVWLPGSTAPVSAGVLAPRGNRFVFRYGRSYRANPAAMAISGLELPLGPDPIEPRTGLALAGCLADAMPDAWGQRVILHRHLHGATVHHDTNELPITTYLLESGADRFGAIDFQRSPTEDVERSTAATLEQLRRAADLLEAGELLPAPLDDALLHGSSIGGARPKALLRVGSRCLIAKFGSRHDTTSVVKAEAVAMNLARRVGLTVAPTEIARSLGHDVLLVERFDRTPDGGRRAVVSALSLLGLDALTGGRYATYYDLADVIRAHFAQPAATLRELYARIVFNILVGNTDDHARNHAAFWDGREYALTPAYDLCPQTRSGGEAVQAMAIGRDGYRFSQFAGCIPAASTYLLERSDAIAIVTHQLDVVHAEWAAAADEVGLTAAERARLLGRSILNPFALEGWPPR